MQNSCRSTDARVCVLHWDDAWIREAVSIRIVFKRASWLIGYTSFEQLNGKTKDWRRHPPLSSLVSPLFFVFSVELYKTHLALLISCSWEWLFAIPKVNVFATFCGWSDAKHACCRAAELWAPCEASSCWPVGGWLLARETPSSWVARDDSDYTTHCEQERWQPASRVQAYLSQLS